MKTSAEKSSSTPSKTATQSAQPFFAKAGNGSFFAPAIQMKMAVSKPGDKFEQEADKMANKVMRMPTPTPITGKEEKLQRQPEDKLKRKEQDKIQKAALPEEKVQKKEDDKLQKAAATEEKLQRKGDGVPSVSANIQSAIQNKKTGGQPLSSDVRGYMEPRFNADFSNVRVHHDADSAHLNNKLSARAFTHQNHVFFSRDQYQPGSSEGKQLLAHELTHTIQQGHAVQRSPQVSTTTTPPPIQRLGLDDALNKFAELANLLPGFRMFTIILGVNPINMNPVARDAANILRAIVEFMPGGGLITMALDNYGIFEKAGSWVEQQIKTLGLVGSAIKQSVTQFLDGLKWTDIFDLGGLWNRAKSIFTDPITRIINLAISMATGILKFIKDAILMPLAKLAEGTAGWDLLCAVLEKNPITGDPVPRTADTLIGGFMKLIGQEEIWQNIKKGNAVARAWAWFQTALSELMGFVRQIPVLFIQTLQTLQISDLVQLPSAFAKVAVSIGSFIGRFISWAGNTIWNLLEIIFEVVAPGVIGYIKKAAGAFRTILKNPIGFAGNLVRAGKMGFMMFASNILTHLKAALIKWIIGPLGEAGVYIPKSFELMEIVKLVLSVLGLTWQNIRSKLVKIIPEPVLVGLEKTAGVLVTLVKDGPAAAWEQIKAELDDLKGQLIAQVTQMISIEVVKAAITKLVMMLNPGGAVIQAIIATYNTITFFIQKINQIAAVVASFIDSIAAIASGQVDAAAQKVEQTMANTLTVIIAFLAKFAGLGNIPEKVVGIVKKIRAPIDKGLDKIVGWLGGVLKKLAGGAKNLADKGKDKDELKQTPEHDKKVKAGLNAIIAEDAKRKKESKVARGDAEEVATSVKTSHPVFKSLIVVDGGGTWDYTFTASPSQTVKGGAKAASPPEKRYLPASIDVRRHLYINGSGFGSARKGIISKALDTVRNKILAIRDKNAKENAKVQHWSWLVNHGLVPADADRDKYTIQKVNAANYDVDHKKPLAKHWVPYGFNCSDGSRQTLAGSDDNLQLLLAKVNRSKGAEGSHYSEKPYVGPSFSSDYNNSPTGSLKIKGKSFRDKNDKALK